MNGIIWRKEVNLNHGALCQQAEWGNYLLALAKR